MRQTHAELLYAISELRMGKCSARTGDFLWALSRELPEIIAREATHIFFRKNPAMLFNQRRIHELPGEIICFDATIENEASEAMRWPGQRRLQLKPNCKAMLVWDKSDELKNGSMGVFVGVEGDALLVHFDEIGVFKIGRETWIKRNRSGQRVGSICQFPVIPAYAVTCHKSQGLTLPAAVIHCSREYVPGLIHVGVSRVRAPECLQVLNFSADQLLTPKSQVIEHCRTQHTRDAVQELSCCRKKHMEEDFFSVQDRFADSVEDSDDQFCFPMEMLDWPAFECFEEDSAPVTLELTEIF